MKNLVVAPSHPAYFKGRFVLKICNDKGFTEVEEKGYTLNAIAINEFKLFIDNNFKKLNVYSVILVVVRIKHFFIVDLALLSLLGSRWL